MQSVEKITDPAIDHPSGSISLGECPAGSIRLHMEYPLLDQIRREVFDKFMSIPRGGLEIGGVLFGRIENGEVRVVAYRNLEIEYLNGPSFALSTTDQAKLLELVGLPKVEPELEGLEAVGWHHSHTRSEIVLSGDDIDIHQKYFPRPEQVALIIKPHKFDPARVGFFLREVDGNLRADNPRSIFAISPPARNANPAASAVSDLPIAPAPAGLHLVHPVVPVMEAPAPPGETKRGRWGIVAAAMILLSAVALYTAPFRRPAPSESAPLWIHLSGVGQELTITWDRTSLAVAQAQAAEIVISDDGNETARVPLDKESLRRGAITYTRHSGNVEVRMRVQSQSDRSTEQVVRFIAPQVAAVPAPLSPSAAKNPDSEMLRMKEELEQLKKELARAPADGMRTRSIAASPVSLASREAGPPAVQAAIPPTDPVIVEPPPVNIPQVQPKSIPMLTPSVQLPAAEPARPVPPRATARVLGSGRAIWTGRMQKGGLLLLDGARPSVGILNGPLPQRPAQFRVYAADLSDSGIVVYSGAARHAAVEAPSAANGWNLTTYNTEPKRAGSVKVLESPGPQNGWKRLLIQSEDRALSMIVIDWSEIPGETER